MIAFNHRHPHLNMRFLLILAAVTGVVTAGPGQHLYNHVDKIHGGHRMLHPMLCSCIMMCYTNQSNFCPCCRPYDPSQESQESQDSQDSQDSQGSQGSQDSQEGQESQDV